jgi:hypothetical protein
VEEAGALESKRKVELGVGDVIDDCKHGRAAEDGVQRNAEDGDRGQQGEPG